MTQDDGYPDMDAIRDAHNAPRKDVVEKTENTVIDAFRESMKIDYDKWHDGIGYNVELLKGATEVEKARIFSLLTPPGDWRDIEALVALDTEPARDALRKAIQSHDSHVRMAVIRYSPESANDDERTALLVHALQFGEFHDGLTSALDQVAEFHPPRVVNALIRGLFVRPGEIATHLAAMLWFLHGKSDDIFDWDQRPLFLEFNSPDGAERERAFVKLCALLGIDAKETRAAAGKHNED